MKDCAKRTRTSGLRFGSEAKGLQLAEASFTHEAFAAHRHDTYALGITVRGVQSFRYRREQQYCLPGQCHILHPDEVHDGKAATDIGFAYRIAYIDPCLIQIALGGQMLPFARAPVVGISHLPKEIINRLMNIDEELDELSRSEFIVAVADFLGEACKKETSCKTSALPFAQLSRVRDLIAAEPTKQIKMIELEQVSGLDRWTIARKFRALFGTSPRRFRTMRQLDTVRGLLENGMSLSIAAVEAGFADQSHMSRHFKSAFGFTPAAWIDATTGIGLK